MMPSRKNFVFLCVAGVTLAWPALAVVPATPENRATRKKRGHVMRIKHLAAAALTILTGAPVAAVAAQLPGHVAPWLAAAHDLGPASPDQTVLITVHLALKHRPDLQRLLAEVSMPSSPSYGKYINMPEFLARFAPDPADVEAVKDFLARAGMTVTRTGAGRTYVQAQAKISQLRDSLRVTQEVYDLRGKKLRANREAPDVPDGLASKISFIDGLDDSAMLIRPAHERFGSRPLRAAGAATPAAGHDITPPPVSFNPPIPYAPAHWGDLVATLSVPATPYGSVLPWIPFAYTPQQVQAAYGMDRVKETGAGIRIAIVDAYASPTIEDDANRYSAIHNLPALYQGNFRQIVPAGIYGVNPDEACGPYDWWEEETLDMEAVHTAAPNASIIYVGARNCDTPLFTALEDTIDAELADIITNSWYWQGEGPPNAAVTALDDALMRAGVLGISVVFCTGDQGDLSQIDGVAAGSYPSTSPYATGVGGTTLEIPASGAKSEYGWGYLVTQLQKAKVGQGGTTITTAGPGPYEFPTGSGGGPSVFQIEPQPDYQVGVVPAGLSGQTYAAGGEIIPLTPLRRVAPDVSMVSAPAGIIQGESFTVSPDASDNYSCTQTGPTVEYCEFEDGGTSLATPLFAGVLARLDEARAAAGRPAGGFVNPLLYSLKLGEHGLVGSALNDVKAPAAPTAALLDYRFLGLGIFVVPVDSEPSAQCRKGVCEGLDNFFHYTRPGYDDVTGLGVPWVPLLVEQ